jgi:hypothetical protein
MKQAVALLQRSVPVQCIGPLVRQTICRLRDMMRGWPGRDARYFDRQVARYSTTLADNVPGQAICALLLSAPGSEGAAEAAQARATLAVWATAHRRRKPFHLQCRPPADNGDGGKNQSGPLNGVPVTRSFTEELGSLGIPSMAFKRRNAQLTPVGTRIPPGASRPSMFAIVIVRRIARSQNADPAPASETTLSTWRALDGPLICDRSGDPHYRRTSRYRRAYCAKPSATRRPIYGGPQI